MRLRVPDIPLRAAAVALAFALIASIVSGVEGPSTETKAPAPEATISGANAQLVPDLDLDKLNRVRESKGVTDLFTSRTPVAPAPRPVAGAAEAPAPLPSPPSAPPLPFRYFGKWIEGNRTFVFLWNDAEGYSASVGDTIAGSYRVESVTDTAVDFVYLPLGSRQTLPITAPN